MPLWLRTAFNYVMAGLLLLAAFFIIDHISVYILRGIHLFFPILLPFLLAVFLSFLLEPMVSTLQRRARLARGPAVAISMLLIFSFFGTIITLVILRLVTELIDLSKSLPFIVLNIQSWVSEALPKMQRLYGDLPPTVINYIHESFGTLTQTLQGFLSSTAQSLLGLFSAVPGVVTVILVSLLATYFISKDRRTLVREWIRVIPGPYGEHSLHITRQVFRAFLAYLRAQGILVSITTLISIVGLYVIGAEYALTMGLLIGFCDIIPVLGPASIYIPWISWLFISGTKTMAIKLLILYLITLTTRQLLETKVVSDNLGLHPLATLVALFIGFNFLGFMGMVLGPILLIAAQAVIKAGINTSRVK